MCLSLREELYIQFTNNTRQLFFGQFMCALVSSDPSLNLIGNVPQLTKSTGSESLNESGPGGGRVGLGQPVLQHAS